LAGNILRNALENGSSYFNTRLSNFEHVIDGKSTMHLMAIVEIIS